MHPCLGHYTWAHLFDEQKICSMLAICSFWFFTLACGR